MKNDDDYLFEQVKEPMNQKPGMKAHFAQGGFKDLNGLYSSGVLEGLTTTGYLKRASS